MYPPQMRHRGVQKSAPHAGAPARRDDDGGGVGYMTVGGFCCLFLLLVAAAADITISSIVVRRSVPRSALSALCDDENVCTWDVLETVHGTTAGVCSHYNYQNDGDCTDACYVPDSTTCQDGECKGTCRGHCEEGNALDCPIISAVNLTALFGYGYDTRDTVTLFRECALSGCLYSIVFDLANASLAGPGFVHAVHRIFDYQSASTTINSSSINFALSNLENEIYEFRVVCMSLIHPDDRECLQAIRFDHDGHFTPSNDCTPGSTCKFDIECSYMFKCTNPPSYDGEIEFAVLEGDGISSDA